MYVTYIFVREMLRREVLSGKVSSSFFLYKVVLFRTCFFIMERKTLLLTFMWNKEKFRLHNLKYESTMAFRK